MAWGLLTTTHGHRRQEQWPRRRSPRACRSSGWLTLSLVGPVTGWSCAFTAARCGSASAMAARQWPLVPFGYSTATLSQSHRRSEMLCRRCGVSGTSSVFVLVRALERVTGIEPAWPAWKVGLVLAVFESLTCAPDVGGVVCTPPSGGPVEVAGVCHGHQGGPSHGTTRNSRHCRGPDDPASEANRAAWEVLSASELPFLLAFSDSDPITGAMAPILRKLIPGTRWPSANQPSRTPATSCKRTPETSWAGSSQT